jgi:hypothetical protein
MKERKRKIIELENQCKLAVNPLGHVPTSAYIAQLFH